MSFAFRVGEDEWETVDGVEQRTILRFDEIFDVSPVTYPAYPETDVSLREGSRRKALVPDSWTPPSSMPGA